MKGKSKAQKPDPTRGELEILKALWKLGPSTVRAVHDQLKKDRKEVQYSTTLKLMQIMTEKGLLKRDERAISHIYETVDKEEKTKSVMLNRFVDTLYQGSPGELLMQLLGSRKTSKKEWEEIRDFVKNLDKKRS